MRCFHRQPLNLLSAAQESLSQCAYAVIAMQHHAYETLPTSNLQFYALAGAKQGMVCCLHLKHALPTGLVP